MKTELIDATLKTLKDALFVVTISCLMIMWIVPQRIERCQKVEVVTQTNWVTMTNYQVEVFTIITNFVPSFAATNPFIWEMSNCLIQSDHGNTLTNLKIESP